MRIAIDIKALTNGSTGIHRYLKEILDKLQQIDTQNEYILFDCHNSEYCFYNPKWRKNITSWFLPGVLWQQFVLPFLIKKHSIDVFWAPEQICPVFFMKKVKIVTSMHDCVALLFPQTSQWSVALINRILLKRSLKKSAIIVTVSNAVKNDVSKLFQSIIFQKKIFTIPNGKPTWQIPGNYDATNREQFLFFAGNLEPRKNLLNLIKGLEKLTDKGQKIHLHIAGPKGWKYRKILEYCEKSRIRNQIHFIGYCTQDQLMNNYLTCKAFVYPSIYEGFGLPILEALSLDSVILTSRGTVMEEIAGPSALYFDPHDPSDIARTIEFIYSRNFDRTEILKHKEIVLNNYSWKSSAEKLKKIFEGNYS